MLRYLDHLKYLERIWRRILRST